MTKKTVQVTPELKEAVYEYVDERIVDHGRWDVTFERIIDFEGGTWRVLYTKGATENQDYDMFDMTKFVELTRVEHLPVTVHQWVEVDEQVGS